MLQKIEIERLRGIRQGELGGLAPLTVLVGRNGCGKTTVLDAILLGASSNTAEAIVRAVCRRREMNSAVRWLFWRTGDEGPAKIIITPDDKPVRVATITSAAGEIKWEIVTSAEATKASGTIIPRAMGFSQLLSYARSDQTTHVNNSIIQIDGKLRPEDQIAVRLIEFQPDGHEPLHVLYSEAVRIGRRNEVKQLIADVLPGVEDLQILAEGNDPIVQLLFSTGSVPVALAGDGILSLVILSLGLAGPPGGVVILEEPEVYQHPAAMRQTAKAIIAAVRRGVQVILSTHSLDLIDLLLDQSNPGDLDRLAVFRLGLSGGELKSTRVPGSDVAFARRQIGDDLR